MFVVITDLLVEWRGQALNALLSTRFDPEEAAITAA
jgi:hypothetical protein